MLNTEMAHIHDWQIDEDFLSRFNKSASEAAIISFDIFDTALTRLFDSPVDVFLETERILLQKIGVLAKGFALFRERAEQRARDVQHLTRGLEEVSIKEIYSELAAILPTGFDLELAIATELEVERRSLIAVPDILEATERLNHVGKEYIFVSDMYLPLSFLEEVLKNNGFRRWKAIYVSCETNCTKATGRIWSEIINTYGNKILHVGDDLHADVINPQAKGISTLGYSRAVSERRVGSKFSPDALPFSKINRNFQLSRRASLDYIDNNLEVTSRGLGFTLGGIVVGTFLRWLSQRLALHKIERVYFCARDGYLLKQAWDTLGFDEILGIKSRYLYVSRASLNIASGIANSSPNRLSHDLLTFLSSSAGKTTVKEAIDRAGLSAQTLINNDALVTFGDLDVVLIWNQNVNIFEEMLQRHASVVYQVLFSRYSNCIAYLKQEGLFLDGRQAMVDLGWHGTMQRSLRSLLLRENGTSELFGFYYGLWPAAKGNRYSAGLMESCFATEYLSWSEQPEVHQGVAILEQLHSAPHGSVMGYEISSDGKALPIFRDNPSEVKQYNEITRYFQEGVLDSIRAYFNGQGICGLTDKILNKDVALAALGAVMLSPSSVELDILKRIGHSATFDHSSHDSIIVEKMPDNLNEAIEIILRSDWRIGQLKQWWHHANDFQKNILRDFIKQHLTWLDKRILRPFS